jgi:hypothetical protein
MKMEPFRIASTLVKLTDQYPEPSVILAAAQKGGEPARIALAQLWLSEGIPYAFRDCPAIYEAVRSWLSTWLSVHAKEIGVTGSARLGASLSPKKLGKPFDETSDLDVFIISNDLFVILKEEFRQWSFDFESGRLKATNNQEERFWRDNNARGSRLIRRGFIDQKMIPNLPDFPTTKKISQAMWLTVEKLKITPNAPKPRYASVRCYSYWDSSVRQTTLNLS